MAVQEFRVDLDMGGNVIKNAKIEVVTTQPTATSIKGFAIYGKDLYFSDGTNITKVADASVVSAIRTELGDKPEDAKGTIYTRLKAAEDAIGNDTGGNSLGTRVTNLENKVNNASTGLAKTKEIADDAVAAAAAAQSTANDAKGTAETNATAIDSLNSAVGDSTKGLVKDVADLKTTVGNASGGLRKEVTDNTASIGTLKTDATTLKGQVGSASDAADATGTLYARVAKNAADISTKVDKVSGKGLSTEDYTSAEKTKLEGIDTGAEVNVIETVNVKDTSGTTALTPSGKAITIDLSKFALAASVAAPLNYMGSKDTLAELPADAKAGDVWNVKQAFSSDGRPYPAGTNVAWVAAKDGVAAHWDPLGGELDLSAYYTKDDLTKAEGGVLNAYRKVSDSYSKTDVDGKVNVKVDKLEASETRAGTYKKVTVTDEGLVSSGEADLAVDDIPALPASKITSGTLGVDRIPALDADKITTGTFDVARIPDIAPSKITGLVPMDKMAIQAKTQSVTAGAKTYEWTHGFSAEPYIVQVVKGGKVIIGLSVTYDATKVVVESNEDLEAGFTIKAIGPVA
jgi:hypothetical protein|nr:MAG TPA: fibritin [Caudoviricetes sp.]